MNKSLVIYPEKCTGCHACEMVCSLRHDGECSLNLSRIGILKRGGGGSNENLPMVCHQCREPFCADACIMGAIVRDENTGGLIVREELCVGCKTCIIACPLGGILYHNIKECSMKCDLCDGDPQCVRSCVYGALEFLTMDEWGRKKRLQGAKNFVRLFDIVYR